MNFFVSHKVFARFEWALRYSRQQFSFVILPVSSYVPQKYSCCPKTVLKVTDYALSSLTLLIWTNKAVLKVRNSRNTPFSFVRISEILVSGTNVLGEKQLSSLGLRHFGRLCGTERQRQPSSHFVPKLETVSPNSLEKQQSNCDTFFW